MIRNCNRYHSTAVPLQHKNILKCIDEFLSIGYTKTTGFPATDVNGQIPKNGIFF